MQGYAKSIHYSSDLRHFRYVNCAIFFRVLWGEIGTVRPRRKAVSPGRYFVQTVSDL